MNWLERFREKISGQKTYLTASAMILTAVAAWSTKTLDGQGLVMAVFAAFSLVFLRAGIAKGSNGSN